MEHASRIVSFAFSRAPLLPVPFHESPDKESVSSDNLGSYRSKCDGPRCATSALLSSFGKKGVPKEVHLVLIKRRPSYARASALVFLSVFSTVSVWVERAIYRGKILSTSSLTLRDGRHSPSSLSLSWPREAQCGETFLIPPCRLCAYPTLFGISADFAFDSRQVIRLLFAKRKDSRNRRAYDFP